MSLIEEFLDYCKDGESFLSLLEYAQNIAKQNGYKISTRQDQPRSSCDPDGYLRWYIGIKATPNASGIVVPASKAISDLYHELGHTFLPKIKPGDPETIDGSPEQRDRELKAWGIGRKLIENSGIEIRKEFWKEFEKAVDEGWGTYKCASEGRVKNDI